MAPKKAAKKAAKKTAGIQPAHKAANDARRTFEHLGRVQVLSRVAHEEQEDLKMLTATALSTFRGQQYKESADLLRAAEHLSFAKLHVGSVDPVAADLQQVIHEELHHLLARAQEHAGTDELPGEIQQIYLRSLSAAQSSLESGSLRAALEFARGAEALAHVHHLRDSSLTSPAPSKQLQR
jgi:hypothetical protein